MMGPFQSPYILDGRPTRPHQSFVQVERLSTWKGHGACEAYRQRIDKTNSTTTGMKLTTDLPFYYIARLSCNA